MIWAEVFSQPAIDQGIFVICLRAQNICYGKKHFGNSQRCRINGKGGFALFVD